MIHPQRSVASLQSPSLKDVKASPLLKTDNLITEALDQPSSSSEGKFMTNSSTDDREENQEFINR